MKISFLAPFREHKKLIDSVYDSLLREAILRNDIICVETQEQAEMFAPYIDFYQI